MKEKKLIIFIPSIEDGGVEKNLYLIANYVGRNNIKTEILDCKSNIEVLNLITNWENEYLSKESI